MNDYVLIYVLCGALVLASFIAEALYESIQKEKEAR